MGNFRILERFIAILTEHCAGNFPLWLAPEQVIILPISEKFIEYSENILKSFNNSDIRASIDIRNEKIGKKIRDAEVKKIPLMIIIGEKEIQNDTLSVRVHREGDKGTLSLQEFHNFFNKKLNHIN